jgi:hypothetical protein
VAFGEGLGVATGFDPALDDAVVAPTLLAVLVLDGAVLRELDRFGFRFAGVVGLFNVLEVFEELCLLALGFRLVSGSVLDRGRVVSRPAFDVPLPPGTVNTTSSRFERCSTCAVAPGWSRKETTVLSPLRCVLTSANPRPRVASARGMSAAGILT